MSSEPDHTEQHSSTSSSKPAHVSKPASEQSAHRNPSSPSPLRSKTPPQSLLPKPRSKGPPTTARRVSTGLGQGSSLGGLSATRIARPSPPSNKRHSPESAHSQPGTTPGRQSANGNDRTSTPSKDSRHSSVAMASSGRPGSPNTIAANERIDDLWKFYTMDDVEHGTLMIQTDLQRFAKSLNDEVPGYHNDWTELQRHLQKHRRHDYQTMSLKLHELKAYYQETYGTELVSDISKASSEAHPVAQIPVTPERTPQTARSGRLLEQLATSNVATPMRRAQSGFANDSVMSTAPEMQSTPVRLMPQGTQYERYKELYEEQKAAKDELQDKFQELQETHRVDTRRFWDAEESLRADVGRLEDEVKELQDKLRKEQENTKTQQTAQATKHTAGLEDQLQEALEVQEELREKIKELRTIERKAEKDVRDMREKCNTIEAAKQREEEKTKKVQAVLEKKTKEHTERFDRMEANNDLLTQRLEEIEEEKAQITQELNNVQHQCEEYKMVAENPINSSINTSTISEPAPTNPFVGENALIQRTATYKHSGMNTEERIGDLILRAEANKDYLAWLNDPTLAAIRLFQKKGMTTETMLGLNVGRLAPAAPRTVEEYVDHSEPPRNAALKKDASGRNWPEDFKPVDEKELDILVEKMNVIDGTPRNTPNPEGTTTNAPIAPLPAPFPGESYTETINTDYATLSQLEALLHKPILEKQDTDFLTTFVLQQSAKPTRHILAAIFQLSPRAAAIIRTKKATEFWGDSLPPIHAPTFLSYPFHLLSSIFTSASLDRSDFAALKTSQARAIESALREQITADAKARMSSENPDKPLKERTFAPLGMAADILRAGPRPAVAWGLATSALWLVLLYLVVHNVVMYWAMRRELKGVSGGGEVDLGGMGGWGSGCYRVCDDGWAWRAKAMFWEVVEERLWGAEANGGWS